jgi:FKBP-type peptidyl-prolyl cis-trans isomerase FkpA
MQIQSKTFIYLFSLVLLTACGDNAQKNNEQSTQSDTRQETSMPPIDEDAAILQLSSYLIASPSNLAEEQQNAIVNYAIDNIIPLERTNSGLFYRILSEGDGAPLKWGNYISAHYKGYFLDGKAFDSSYKRDEPLQFYIGNMVSGWNEGLQLIRPGGKIQLFIPNFV